MRIILIFLICAIMHGVAAAATCDAGYYLENEECKECNPDNEPFYCPGDDTRQACPTTDTDYEKLSGWTLITGSEGTYAGGATASDSRSCYSGHVMRDSHGSEVLVECPFNGENYWCATQLWYVAGDGYYLADYNWTSAHDWYNEVKQCTNAPANAHYTGPGTPDAPDGSVVDANDCPWECDAGYGKNATGECVPCSGEYFVDGGVCKITCQPGYFVETAGAQCTEITDNYTYTDAPHTITYGETSDAFLKHCPRTADGSRGYVPWDEANNSINSCVLWVSGLRMSQRDRYDDVICRTSDIHSCVWLTHGIGAASCFYTTGADGAAIYDNQKNDPETGNPRRGCVGKSELTECDAGYYAPYVETGAGLQHHPCNPVGTAYWSPDKDLNRYECPAGTATCGVGECADSADDCLPYKTMKIDGHGDVLLFAVKRSQKALAVMYPDGSVYYGMMTPVTQPRGLHVQSTDGTIHSVLSPTDSFVTYGQDTLMFDATE